MRERTTQRYLAERGHIVTGVDQSPEMLDLAREKVPGGRFLPGDLLSLPLDDGSVDAAVCALALVHVADVAAAIAELARVVRPGGRIVITDVHPVLVMLGWQAQFPTADGRGFMRLHPHLVSDYLGGPLPPDRSSPPSRSACSPRTARSRRPPS